MRVVYEPRGPAREYADLACNLYGDAQGKFGGCSHGCLYCYCPEVLRIPASQFHCHPRPKKNVLTNLRRDAEELAELRDARRVLFSFIGDPYCPEEISTHTTRQALKIMTNLGLNFDVLTKGGGRVERDLDLLQAAGASLGVSLVWSDEDSRAQWEPGARSLADRWRSLALARAQGIRTWLSVEPVIDPAQVLELLTWPPDVDEFRVGKINHRPELEAAVDWQDFVDRAYDLLLATGKPFLIKDSLRPYLRGKAQRISPPGSVAT